MAVPGGSPLCHGLAHPAHGGLLLSQECRPSLSEGRQHEGPNSVSSSTTQDALPFPQDDPPVLQGSPSIAPPLGSSPPPSRPGLPLPATTVQPDARIFGDNCFQTSHLSYIIAFRPASSRKGFAAVPRNKHIWLKRKLITKSRGKDLHLTEEASLSVHRLAESWTAVCRSPDASRTPGLRARAALPGAEARRAWVAPLPSAQATREPVLRAPASKYTPNLSLLTTPPRGPSMDDGGPPHRPSCLSRTVYSTTARGTLPKSSHVPPLLTTLQWLPSHSEQRPKSSPWPTRPTCSVPPLLLLSLSLILLPFLGYAPNAR